MVGICHGVGVRCGGVKILHTSDWHVGRAIRGRSRAHEHREVLTEIVGLATTNDVDLVIVSGDLFDVGAPTPESESIVFRTLLDLAAVAPVVAISGNHDNPRRFQALQPLLDLGRISVGAGLARPDDGGVVSPPGLDCRIALVPWTSQRGIVKADDLMSLDPDDHGGKYAERMRAVITALTRDFTTSTVNLAVGHLMVHGAVEGGSERQAHIFGYAVPPSVFPTSLSYVALGHLHRQQKVPNPAPTWYSGSPLQLDFGEVGDRKGVLLIDAEPGLPAKVEPVALEGGRRLELVRGTVEQISAQIESMGDAYLKAVVEEPSRSGLAAEVRGLSEGIVDVVLAEPTASTVREPVPQRLDRPEPEVFAEYLESRNVHDPAVVAMFTELLDEAHAT